MEFQFLGTGAGIPSKGRNVSAMALRFMTDLQGTVWLFDCGEATQHQVLHTNLKLWQISKIFITHMHGDHIYGLPGVLGSRSFQGAESPLKVYGPKGIKEFITVTLETSRTYLKYPLEIIEIDDGFIEQENGYRIEVRQLEHVIPSYGFRIKEPDQPGRLKVEKLKEQGIPSGPIYGKLKAGQSVTLDDGRIINGADYTTELQPGRIVTICGDTRPSVKTVELARDADLFIHEATFAEGMDEKAIEYFHSTTNQAAQIAKDANVKRLILNHISSRYHDRSDELLESAVRVFPNTALAHDFSIFQLTKRNKE
ncbi:ribonuclease Z [Pseudalkalibacillus berkeleyi]|uniref:Ribonuclease Z n=1 Tax=Pseudalkalibacillus berkeleyi TaxID=1069813 RepID=A0ABS9GX45_9BACL|nr:ribonuclease Z [Pseudalkalibacillus berkeleyi]MCF6136301.1 ribonuclease Z [Pseudalkalibacillus berkeleyi]